MTCQVYSNEISKLCNQFITERGLFFDHRYNWISKIKSRYDWVCVAGMVQAVRVRKRETCGLSTDTADGTFRINGLQIAIGAGN